jgi:hypothetical protein
MKKLLIVLLMCLTATMGYAADTKISGLATVAPTATGLDLVTGLQGGANKNFTHLGILGLAGWAQTPAATCLLGYSATWQCLTEVGVLIGNTAAQFVDSTPPKNKYVKIDPVGVTATKTATVAFSNTENATYTFPVLGGTVSLIAGIETLTNKTLTDSKINLNENTTDLTWSGTSLVRVCLAATSIGQAVYIDSAGKAVAAQANAAATLPAIGVNVTTTTGANEACTIVTHGLVTQNTWGFTAGNRLYVSAATAGLITATAPATATNIVQKIGVAISDDTILVMPALTEVTVP